jgi:hypothetical protein
MRRTVTTVCLPLTAGGPSTGARGVCLCRPAVLQAPFRGTRPGYASARLERERLAAGRVGGLFPFPFL